MINLFYKIGKSILKYCVSFEYAFGRLNKKHEKAFFDILKYGKKAVSKTKSTNFATRAYNN
jgi:hypothetical protein